MLSSQASSYAPAGTNEINAPWNQPDETRQGFECAICKAVGYEEYPDSDSFEEEDGTDMPEATFAPGRQWVCSLRCLSQLMFQSASPDLQYQMKRFERAVVMIAETSDALREYIRVWGMDEGLDGFVEYASESGTVFSSSDTPRWINENVDPEDALRVAMRAAIGHLQWHPLVSNRATIQLEIELAAKKKGNQYEAGRAATSLAAVGQAILSLQQALDGEVR
jgi:hypothetical protein